MTNVISILTRKPVMSGPEIARSAMCMRAMPSWVLAEAVLNRAVWHLQQSGWRVEAMHNQFYCYHHQIKRFDGKPFDLAGAYEANALHHGELRPVTIMHGIQLAMLRVWERVKA